MKESTKLVCIKSIHTLIWLFFNGVILYLFYAVITDHINLWVWLGLCSFLVEGIVLLVFRNSCPLTLWARRYSSSNRDNFDIYIPNWLARYNKLIYSALLAIVVMLLIYQLTK